VGQPEAAEIVSPCGSLQGLNGTGFLDVADVHGVGACLSNDTACSAGDRIEVVAATRKVTCDTDKSGMVDATDARTILRFAVGLGATPACVIFD
jgi:hypothetical protein